MKPYIQSVWSQLLDRVFNILRENNPDLAGDRRRTVMRPPQVLREGTKKTVFVNFMDLCKTYDPTSFDYHLLFIE
jgi:translation initiation factor 2 subunit 2